MRLSLLICDKMLLASLGRDLMEQLIKAHRFLRGTQFFNVNDRIMDR